MPRTYKKIYCSKTDIISLHEMSVDTGSPRLALRAQIVLRCIDGQQIKDIAAELGERPNTVILWRDRFSANGLEGLLNLPRGNSANKYGTNLKHRILEKLNTAPPPGFKRWTGKSLSTDLGVPPDVVWRCLRKEKIRLADTKSTQDNAGAQQEDETYDIPLRLSIRKDEAMADRRDKNTGNDNSNAGNATADGCMDLIITARVVGKDGTVIEKEIRLDDALPNLKDFDLSTREGFLRDFGQLEKSMLSARGQLTEDITREYLDAASKKNESEPEQ